MGVDLNFIHKNLAAVSLCRIRKLELFLFLNDHHKSVSKQKLNSLNRIKNEIVSGMNRTLNDNISHYVN